jgi:hypothetical protein
MSRNRAYRLLLVTNELQERPAGGRELLCRLNHDALKEILGERMEVLELPRRPIQGVKPVVDAFRGHIDGVSRSAIAEALSAIRAGNIDKVFVDGSNLGGFVKAVKQGCPAVEVSTFFHNVEARFFFGSLRQRLTLRALGVLVANYLAERRAVGFSDKLICLSERDSRLLRRLYGRAATHVSPLAMRDQMPLAPAAPMPVPISRFALFVGGGFYANRSGIAWFARHVVPRIQVRLVIVGRGFDDLKTKLESTGAVEVVGAVDHLSDWYRNAHFVVAPIFDGSGMKTKVAEALMHGKKVVGTPEAFSGYESVADRAGWVCSTPDEFVAAIARAGEEVTKPFDPALRALYEETYSLSAARSRLAHILESVR